MRKQHATSPSYGQVRRNAEAVMARAEKRDEQRLKKRSGEVGNAGWCGKCEQWAPDGPDICIGRLRGVTAACCGHGEVVPYVAFGVAAFDYDPDGFSVIALYGPSAEAYFAHVREHPDEPFCIDGDAWMRYEPYASALASADNEQGA